MADLPCQRTPRFMSSSPLTYCEPFRFVPRLARLSLQPLSIIEDFA